MSPLAAEQGLAGQHGAACSISSCMPSNFSAPSAPGSNCSFTGRDRAAPVGGERDAINALHVSRTRLGELACQPADLDNWYATTIDHDNRHLQQDAEGVSYPVGAEVREAFSTVTTCEHKFCL